jgi:hypothetical protein
MIGGKVLETDKIQNEVREKVSGQISVKDEGQDRYRVFTPFKFNDGDHLAIVLKKVGDSWLFTDEGHTLMHLTYEIDEKDLRKGNRARIISDALSGFGVEDSNGEFSIAVNEEQFGNALFSFVQGLLKVTDVTFLKRERVKAIFQEDFRTFFSEQVPATRRSFDWYDPGHDPQKKYLVDCKINGMAKPLFVFALSNDSRVRDATITLQQFERWQLPFRAVGVFENQEEVNRKVLSRFSDVCDRQFSSLTENKDRIQKFLTETLVG